MNIALHLDLRTVTMMMAGINLLFAGTLALVGAHAGKVRGARQWALGNLCIGICYASAGLLVSPPSNLIIVLLAMTLAVGLGLMYNGIEAFKEQRCRYGLTAALALLMAVQSTWFVLHDDVQGRIAANWFVYALINLACARALFVRIAQPLRTAYWLAACSFLAIAMSTLARSVVAIIAPSATVRLFEANNASPAVFFVMSMAQMSLSFALVLMINYRLGNDLRDLASTDALTGLLNRGRVEEEIHLLAARAERGGDPFSVMMIDVDHFKAINDRHGHPGGDEVLRQLAALMKSMIRRGDYLGRYGGEEFCIVLPGAVEAEAMVLAERLRQRYADLRVAWDGELLSGTVSIGVADWLAADDEVRQMMALADQALYRAKDEGRNRVAAHSASVALGSPGRKVVSVA